MKTLNDLHSSLSEINQLIESYDREIRYIEEALVSTSGPAQHLIDDLESNKARRLALQRESGAIHEQIEELKK